MALILAKVDADTICLVRRWSSYKIIRYIYTTTKIFAAGLSVHMLQHRN